MFTLVDIIVKGGLVMIPLLFCSVIALAVVIERAMFWRRIGADDGFQNVFDAIENHDLARARELALAADSPAGRVLAAGVAHVTRLPGKAMEVAAQGQIPILRKRLTILDTVITLAPLLGLLGTVIGMIGSFDIIGQRHRPASLRHWRRSRSVDSDCHWTIDRDSDTRSLQLFFQSCRERNGKDRVLCFAPGTFARRVKDKS